MATVTWSDEIKKLIANGGLTNTTSDTSLSAQATQALNPVGYSWIQDPLTGTITQTVPYGGAMMGTGFYPPPAVFLSPDLKSFIPPKKKANIDQLYRDIVGLEHQIAQEHA